MRIKSECNRYEFKFKKSTRRVTQNGNRMYAITRMYTMDVTVDGCHAETVRFSDWDAGMPILLGFFRRRAAMWLFNQRLTPAVQLPVGRTLIKQAGGRNA